MKIIQVLPRIAAESSGPSYSVTRLSESLDALNQEVQLHVLEPIPHRFAHSKFQICAYPSGKLPGAWRFGWSSAMRRGLMQAGEDASIVHNHSLWMMPNIYVQKAAIVSGAKLVFSPRGTLSKWATQHSRVRKNLVWHGGQKSALLAADCVHATSQEEVEDIRRAGVSVPIALIPNGVDIPNMDLQPEVSKDQKTLVFLSRIHEKKGVDLLLHAWQQIAPLFPDWQLKIVGPLNGEYPRQMARLAQDLSLPRATFEGELTGDKKTDAFAAADLFVLPTHSENFGMAIAEALAHGVPVITTKNAPWSGLEAKNCGWWIDLTLPTLVEALAAAMNQPPEKLQEMGSKGRDWMASSFAWSSVAQDMLLLYKWIDGDGTKPEFIICE